MDIGYLRAHPEHLPAFLTHQRIRETPVPGGDICTASRLTLDDGTSIFTKAIRHGPAPEGFFATEAAGLRWLAAAFPDHPPVPAVVAALPELLALEWIEPGEPSPAAAEQLGRDLATMHRAGAEVFGADRPGFIGSLSQDNTPSPGPWSTWFAHRRLAPYLRRSFDNQALSAADARLIERVLETIHGYAADEAPARIHGDLWPGNVLWGADGRGWLVDPAAHGGHRETDLAQLALFGGAPHLDRVLGAYAEVFPLTDGWRERVPLHHLHLLLVHTALFGAAYRDAVVQAAHAVLSA